MENQRTQEELLNEDVLNDGQSEGQEVTQDAGSEEQGGGQESQEDEGGSHVVREHLLTVEEFRRLARPTSKHIDEDEVCSYIRECEDMTIIPAIGFDTYEKLLSDNLSDDEKTLLNGGTWVQGIVGRCNGQNGLRRKCSGLKTALSYFVYAKMIQSDGSIVTRTGAMRHNDEYASHIEDKKARYNDVMNVAEEYLSGCLQYWKSVKSEDVHPVRGSRVHIHAIGD